MTLKSDTADFMQCSPKGAGDHILAASFLSEFVENDTPWVHMDLSAGDNEGGLGARRLQSSLDSACATR